MEEEGWGFIGKVIFPVGFYSLLRLVFCTQSFNYIPNSCSETTFSFLSLERSNTVVVVCHLVFLVWSGISEADRRSPPVDVPYRTDGPVCLISLCLIRQTCAKGLWAACWLTAQGWEKGRRKGNSGRGELYNSPFGLQTAIAISMSPIGCSKI